jgi:hypothetical protein
MTPSKAQSSPAITDCDAITSSVLQLKQEVGALEPSWNAIVTTTTTTTATYH